MPSIGETGQLPHQQKLTIAGLMKRQNSDFSGSHANTTSWPMRQRAEKLLKTRGVTMDQNFFDVQSLRLLRAFFKVRDHDARELLIHLAEAAERGASIDGTVGGAAVDLAAGNGKIVSLPISKKQFK